MHNLLQQSGDEQRLNDLRDNDAENAQFDARLRRVTERDCRNCPYRQTGEGEGRDCECCREASEAAVRGLWACICNTVRDMDVGDWLAVLALVCAIAAYWTH